MVSEKRRQEAQARIRQSNKLSRQRRGSGRTLTLRWSEVTPRRKSPRAIRSHVISTLIRAAHLGAGKAMRGERQRRRATASANEMRVCER